MSTRIVLDVQPAQGRLDTERWIVRREREIHSNGGGDVFGIGADVCMYVCVCVCVCVCEIE